MKNQTFKFQMNEILKDIDESVKESIEVALDKIPAETAKQLRNTSPKRPGGGEYAKGWRVARSRKYKTATVKNTNSPSLTHLLEYGHAIVNQYGRFGRVNGIKHIKPARDDAWNKIDEVINKELEKDGIK